MLDKTDKQVGAILEAIQGAAPGVLEQAVTYWRFAYSAWIVGFLLIVGLCAAVFFWCLKKQREFRAHNLCTVNCIDYVGGGYFAGVISCVALSGAVIAAVCLIQTYIAPDYFAAECAVELGRKALGN